MRRRYRPGPFGYGPYPGRGYGYGYGRSRGGGSCLRDACLIESGCCLAEALGDGCLIGLVLIGLVRPSRRGAGDGLLVASIRAYQEQVSPRRPACCRFTPTCSQYATTALLTHGTVRGCWLTLRRLLRCRPFGRRGFDPVPAR